MKLKLMPLAGKPETPHPERLPSMVSTAIPRLLLILFPKIPHPVFDTFNWNVAFLWFSARDKLFVQEAIEFMALQRLHATASRVAIDAIVGRHDAQTLSRSRSFHLAPDQVVRSPSWT